MCSASWAALRIVGDAEPRLRIPGQSGVRRREENGPEVISRRPKETQDPAKKVWSSLFEEVLITLTWVIGRASALLAKIKEQHLAKPVRRKELPEFNVGDSVQVTVDLTLFESRAYVCCCENRCC